MHCSQNWTKTFCFWGSAQDPAGGAYSAPRLLVGGDGASRPSPKTLSLPRPSASTFGPVGIRFWLFGTRHLAVPLKYSGCTTAIWPNVISSEELFSCPSVEGLDGLTVVNWAPVTKSCTCICGTLKAALLCTTAVLVCTVLYIVLCHSSPCWSVHLS